MKMTFSAKPNDGSGATECGSRREGIAGSPADALSGGNSDKRNIVNPAQDRRNETTIAKRFDVSGFCHYDPNSSCISVRTRFSRSDIDKKEITKDHFSCLMKTVCPAFLRLGPVGPAERQTLNPEADGFRGPDKL